MEKSYACRYYISGILAVTILLLYSGCREEESKPETSSSEEKPKRILAEQIQSAPVESRDFQFMRSSERMPDGRIKIGGLAMEKNSHQDQWMIKVGKLDENGNFAEEAIGMDQLHSIATGILVSDVKLQYGVSHDNELILFREVEGKIEVVRNSDGAYAIRENKDLIPFVEGSELVKGILIPDGRIKVELYDPASEK